MEATDAQVEAVARAIWATRGGTPRLLFEKARPGTNLAQQQAECFCDARAAISALRALDAEGERVAITDAMVQRALAVLQQRFDIDRSWVRAALQAALPAAPQVTEAEASHDPA